MPVFAALAGGKVALYHPLQTPASGKVALAGVKVLYRPLEQFFCVNICFYEKLGKQLKQVHILCCVHF
jgi:hypothetical protein